MDTQKCQLSAALPNQFTGAVIITQQCPWRNAPTYLREATEILQKCQWNDRLSREGSANERSNVRRSTPFSTSYRGSVLDRRNAKDDAPPPNLGHLNYAAMLISKRPINFNQRPNRIRRNALFPTPRNQGDPIWIQDMKTRLSLK